MRKARVAGDVVGGAAAHTQHRAGPRQQIGRRGGQARHERALRLPPRLVAGGRAGHRPPAAVGRSHEGDTRPRSPEAVERVLGEAVAVHVHLQLAEVDLGAVRAKAAAAHRLGPPHGDVHNGGVVVGRHRAAQRCDAGLRRRSVGGDGVGERSVAVARTVAHLIAGNGDPVARVQPRRLSERHLGRLVAGVGREAERDAEAGVAVTHLRGLGDAAAGTAQGDLDGAVVERLVGADPHRVAADGRRCGQPRASGVGTHDRFGVVDETAAVGHANREWPNGPSVSHRHRRRAPDRHRCGVVRADACEQDHGLRGGIAAAHVDVSHALGERHAVQRVAGVPPGVCAHDRSAEEDRHMAGAFGGGHAGSNHADGLLGVRRDASAEHGRQRHRQRQSERQRHSPSPRRQRSSAVLRHVLAPFIVSVKLLVRRRRSGWTATPATRSFRHRCRSRKRAGWHSCRQPRRQ